MLCDGEDGWVAAIVEHVERAGVHSGDSACVLPAPSVGERLEAEIRELASTLVRGLGARGLLNLQLALHDGDLYVLEANPRASRTVPFVAKATAIPLVDHACRLLLGAALAELDLPERAVPTRAWAKEAIFPTERFTGAADRGVEMRSTGEVMASGPDARRRPTAARSRRPEARTADRRDRSTAAGERVSVRPWPPTRSSGRRRSSTACRCRSSRRRVTPARRR